MARSEVRLHSFFADVCRAAPGRWRPMIFNPDTAAGRGDIGGKAFIVALWLYGSSTEFYDQTWKRDDVVKIKGTRPTCFGPLAHRDRSNAVIAIGVPPR